MAVRFCDSFDSYSSSQIARKWTSVSGSPIIQSGGRNSTNRLRLDDASAAVSFTVSGTPPTGGTAGFAWLPASRTTGQLAHFSVYDGATLHLYFDFDGSGHLLIKRGDGTTLGTGTTVISIAAYTYVEFKWVIHDTTGSIEVRLNGSGSSEISATNIDTRNGGNASWDKVLLQGLNGALNGNINNVDDFYLVDNNGSAPTNTFLGDCRVECLLPSTGNGTNTGLTPSTGSDHGALVDESTPNDNTDYNSGTTVGVKDTYNYPSLSVNPLTIYAIQPAMCAEKSSAGAKTACHVVRSGGTDYDGATITLSTSYTYYPEIWETDPATGVAWVAAGITALEAGVKVVS